MWLSFRTLHHRPGSFLAAFVALTLASVVVVATAVLIDTGERSAGPAPTVDADVLVVGAPPPGPPLDGDLPRPLAEAVARVERALEPSLSRQERTGVVPDALVGPIGERHDVEAVTPLVRVAATLVGTDGTLVEDAGSGQRRGASWHTELDLASGRAPRAADEVAVHGDLAARAEAGIDDVVRLQTDAGTDTYRVVGLVSSATDASRTTIWFEEAQARQLRGAPDGHVDELAVTVGPGSTGAEVAAEVAELVAPAEVLHGRELAELAQPGRAEARELIRGLGGSFVGVVLLVVAIVVGSVLSVGLQGRRHDLALLRTLGLTPRQVRRLVGGEAAILAVTAGAVALPGAYALAHLALRRATEFGVLPAPLELVVGPRPALAGIGAVTLIAWSAARVAARRATRRSPVAATAEGAGHARLPGRVRTGAGISLLVLGVLTLVVPPFVLGPVGGLAGAGAATLVVIVAVILLGPWLVHGAAVGSSRLLGVTQAPDGPVHLAIAATLHRAPQLAAVCGVVVLAGAFGGVAGGVQFQQAAAAETHVRDSLVADLTVTSHGPGVPATALQDLEQLPSVTTVSGVRQQPLIHLYAEFGLSASDATLAERVTATAVDPATFAQVLDVGIVTGTASELGRDTVLLGRTQAAMAGLEVGDVTEVVLPDAVARQVEVVGVYEHDLALGAMVVSHELLDGHRAGDLYDQAHLVAGVGVSPAALAGELDGLATKHPGLVEAPRAQAIDDAVDAGRSERWVNLLLVAALGALAYVAVLNALVTGIVARAGEFATLRLAGAHVHQVRSQLRWEAGIVSALCLAVTVTIVGIATTAIEVSLSGQPVPQLPVHLLVGLAIVPLVLVLAANEVATRMTLRRDPVRAIAAEV